MNLVEIEMNYRVFLDEYDFLVFVCVSSDIKKNGMVNYKVIYDEFLKELIFIYLIKR